MTRLFWQAALAVLALPGMVAVVIPLTLLAPSARFRAAGLVPLAIGFGLLVWCVRDFYVAGKGTLAPWAPPKELVVVGLYRVSRNPMYIAVTLVLWGWALGYHSRALTIYALAVMLGFHLRVVLAEEPWLARRYGKRWVQYSGQEPRWICPPMR